MQLVASGSAEKQQESCNEKSLNKRLAAQQDRSSKRMVKNMPMRSNRRVVHLNQHRKHGKQFQQFIDSDFYDNQSINRGAAGSLAPGRLLRSTSPVSSQASTFLK